MLFHSTNTQLKPAMILTKLSLDIRLQLNDQLRCLDSRLESQQSQLLDMQDIFRRRAEIELAYSRDLEKLAKVVSMRHKEQKQKREGWSSLSSTDVWVQMVANTRKVGRDHAALAEIFANDIPSRCISISDDLGRIYRQVNHVVVRGVCLTFLRSAGILALRFTRKC